MESGTSTRVAEQRRSFIGGSDARIIMGSDEAALIRLWQEKRGEVEAEDFSGNLIVQLGRVTEDLNRLWFERNTGQEVKDVQRRVRHPVNRWMGATLDGLVEATGAVFEAKFMLPWSFSEEGAAEKHMAQLQHNMWVVNAKMAALSIITGGGKWVEIVLSADPLYQHLLITAERKFWRCVETGDPPRLFGIEPPRPRLGAVRIVDMNASNSWAEFATMFRNTKQASLDREKSKAELKGLMPEDHTTSPRLLSAAYRSDGPGKHVRRLSVRPTTENDGGPASSVVGVCRASCVAVVTPAEPPRSRRYPDR